MSTLEALYFPGTEIYSGSQFPALLMFQKTHLLQPVETSATADNAADIFKTAGLCQAHTPCPLGKDRDRFLHLIRDLRERKDDYAAQLSSLTVAALSEKKSSVDDTQYGIMSSLLGNHGGASQPEEDTDTLLWQARLVLKIGEIFDQEQEEVAMHMALLDDQQDNLLKTLQGEINEDEETLFAELQQLKAHISHPTASTIKNRLSAWSKLYLEATSAEPAIWLTHMVEAADILLERYQEATKAPAPIIAEFELPANIGWARDKVVDEIHAFQENNRGLLADIAEAFSAPATASIKPLSERWAEALENAFPRDNTGRTALTLYHLADISCGGLLGKADSPGTLLAVVRWLE